MVNKIDLPIAVASRSFSKNINLRNELEGYFSSVRYNETGRALAGEDLLAFLKECTGAIIALEKITRDVLISVPGLKFIGKYGVGLDSLDLNAMKEFGVQLGWSGGHNKESVAELALCFMIGICREIFTSISNMKSGNWIVNGGNQLSEKTIGVIGCGNAGRRLISLLEPFNCKILGNDILPMKEYFRAHKIEESSKEKIFNEADIISIHIPYSAEVHHFIGEKELSLMQSHSVLINTARGGLVDESALFCALASGSIRAAAFDVFENEPYKAGNLLSVANFFPTSHIGGSADEAILNMGRAAIFHLYDIMKNQ